MGILVKFNIELSDSDVEIIGRALDERPYKDVVNLVARIQSQINSQQPKPLQEAEG
jgi:hypothetical protein